MDDESLNPDDAPSPSVDPWASPSTPAVTPRPAGYDDAPSVEAPTDPGATWPEASPSAPVVASGWAPPTEPIPSPIQPTASGFESDPAAPRPYDPALPTGSVSGLGEPPAGAPRLVPAPPTPGTVPIGPYTQSGPPPAPPAPMPASTSWGAPIEGAAPFGSAGVASSSAAPGGSAQPLASTPSGAPGSRRGMGSVLTGVLASFLALALLATGFVFARATDDGDDDTQASPTPVIATTPTDPDEPPPPGPLEGAEVEEPVAAVAQAVLPSVVLITTDVGQGSGIGYADGLVVSNAHVIGDATTVTVQLASGAQVQGDVLGTDPDRDLAVIEIPVEAGLEPAVFAPSSTVTVGQLAVALGSPFGLEQTVTSGVVSAVDRVVPGGLDGQVPVAMVQTDAPINPGNSGGALADREGRIIGMNTAIRTDTGTFSGVGFAIPSDTITLIATRIVNGESLEMGFLGVGIDNATTTVVGAIITDVVDGSPAEGSGLRPGDVIVGLDAKIIENRADLSAAIRLRKPGETVDITFVRDGSETTVSVTLATN